ncbi:hypothetical protein AB685_14835 [Bacillus sp. LL01]|uniref:hypothetical protein n=1 Tax=Bacillus sp. LL01 TaxID=1665556 RepID=UPI00064CEB14|nr:hypothetical protein [Bacillus sp. LL01]KMJ58080.1 hypothetical protein AB685_14835 [Bacillus sp. LL01]
MPIVPMKQTITVQRGGGLDEWGNPIPGELITMNCRVDEGTRLSASRSGGLDRNGETAVSFVRILLDKLADIRYDDILTFTNELGEEITGKPKEINVRRNVGGKPILTEVKL